MTRKQHHGGAWKVAYADFVTAMMALFLVLWLTAQDQRIKQAVERAFRNPFDSVTKQSVGIIPNKNMQAVRSHSGNFDSASAVELTMLRRLNQDLMKSLKSELKDAMDRTVRLELTPEGVRINVFDRARKPIFKPDSTQTTTYGHWVLSTLAWDISRYTNFLVDVEGHTEKDHHPTSSHYDPWELSADRANVARRILEKQGVLASQIHEVSGFAATKPLKGYPPEDEINRRVTILLKVAKNKSRHLVHEF